MIRGFKKEKKEKRSATSKNPYEFWPSIFISHSLRSYIRSLSNVLVYLCSVCFEKKYRFRYLSSIFPKLPI